MKSLVCILSYLVGSISCYAQSDKSITTALTEELEEIAQRELLVGFSVGIYNAEGNLYERGFGYADKAERKEYTVSTIQNIASISKTFIGLALLKAQELGKLDLDDPINMHLPFEVINPFYPEDVITIRQLASHTSSIQDRGWWYGFNSYVLKEKKKRGEKKKIYFSNPDKMMSLAQLYENFLKKGGKSYKKKNFLKHKPGSNYQYSNIAAALGAYIIEEATGESFKAFTQRYIFDPLEMTDTGWSFDDIDINHHSKIYTQSKKPLAFYSLVTYPDGGLRTSASDISKYASELLRGTAGRGSILSKESYKEAFTGALSPEQVAGRGGDNYAVFFEISENNQIGHSGSDPGVATLMYFDPIKGVGRYLQVNTEVGKKNSDAFIEIYNTLKEYEGKIHAE